MKKGTLNVIGSAIGTGPYYTWPSHPVRLGDYAIDIETGGKGFGEPSSDISDEDLVEYILSEPVRQMLWAAGYELAQRNKTEKEYWDTHRRVPRLREIE